MCELEYLWTDSLKIWLEHNIGHHKLQRLRNVYVHAQRVHVSARVLTERVLTALTCVRSLKRILSFGWIILQGNMSCMCYVLFMFTHRARPNRVQICTFKCVRSLILDGFFPNLVNTY
jgi:hypothetical protein